MFSCLQKGLQVYGKVYMFTLTFTCLRFARLRLGLHVYVYVYMFTVYVFTARFTCLHLGLQVYTSETELVFNERSLDELVLNNGRRLDEWHMV